MTYTVYLTTGNKLKLQMSVTASSIHIATEKALARAKAKTKLIWKVYMIWYSNI
jgi:hypothetical protein